MTVSKFSKMNETMKTSRRDFISTSFAGGIAAAMPEYLIEPKEKTTPESRYAIIDKIMKL